MITSAMANLTVSDLAAAREWYAVLFGRDPDDEPMPGLLEWHLGEAGGLQLWREPDRAGRSGATLTDSDLDATAARLTTAGVEHDGPQPGGGARILQLADPDGNRVVLTGE